MDRRRNPIPEHIQGRITKIFVTNLPEGCSGSDLASQIRVFGQIFGLYIARKRDRGGNRFGFVSMLDVKDKEELLKNLRSIRMDGSKLWFNIARFVLEDGEINTAREKPAPKSFVNSNVTGGVEQSGTKFRTSERSFKNLFEGKSITIDSQVNAFSTFHGRALAVRMIDLEALKNIHVILNDICPGFGKVQYLGGLDMLISFEESKLAANVLEAAKLLKDRFYSITLWEGQSLSFERLAWLKVQGIPLHLLTNDVINRVGGKFGKVVHKAMKSESDSDLSFEYIGVLVGDGKRISEEVVLNWKNRKFRVWVTEELGDWIPEFYAVKSGEQDIDSTNDEEIAGVANVVDMPEVLPVNTDDVGDDIINNVDPIIFERNDDDISDNIDCQSSPIIEKNLNSEVTNETFVPAVNFDFDQVIEDNNNTVISASNVVKRKKFKKSEVGRSSCAYTSSNESLKVVKKPKNSNNDLFGLNNLLGITNDDPGSEDDSWENEEDGSIDLNSNPHVTDKAAQPVMEERHSLHEEMEATKLLGQMLGVNFAGHDILIRETIINEGLQTGSTTNQWVAWALNIGGSGMIGAQALVAVTSSNGSVDAYTSAVTSFSTTLQRSTLSFEVPVIRAERINGDVVIYATLVLPRGGTSFNQVWQVGPVNNGAPGIHGLGNDNRNSVGSVDFSTGQTGAGGSVGGSRMRRRNTHGVLNAVSWGVLMPLGAMTARYLKVFKVANPAWFYIHAACQTSAYGVGVAGWATGLKLGSDSAGITHTSHRNIGIILFSLGTLQVFALLLRPKPDNKYRFYWNIYHHGLGYSVIILSIINVYEGLDILDPEKKWKHAYTGILISLGAITVLLEALTWFIVLKRKKEDKRTHAGTNGSYGANGSA